MSEPSSDGIKVDSGVEELGGRVVAEFLERAGDAAPAGIATVAVGHGVGIPRRAAVRFGRERVGASGYADAEIGGISAAAAEPVAEQLACQRVEGYPAAVAVLGRLLDVLPVLNQVVVGESESLPGEIEPVLAKAGDLTPPPASGEGQPQVEPEFLVLGEYHVEQPGRLLGSRRVRFMLTGMRRAGVTRHVPAHPVVAHCEVERRGDDRVNPQDSGWLHRLAHVEPASPVAFVRPVRPVIPQRPATVVALVDAVGVVPGLRQPPAQPGASLQRGI